MQSVAQAGLPPFVVASEQPPVIISIFINENGSVDGWQWHGSVNIKSLEEELKNIRILSPAGFNGKAIPSWTMLTIDMRLVHKKTTKSRFATETKYELSGMRRWKPL